MYISRNVLKKTVEGLSKPLRVDGGDAAGEVRLWFDHDRMRERKIRRVRVQQVLHIHAHTFMYK